MPSYSEHLASLEALWNLKRGTRLLPSRSDFTPEDLRPWLGNLAVVAVEREPRLRFLVTLSGTQLDDYRGHGVTGQYIDTIGEAITGTGEHYLAALKNCQPVRGLYDNSANSAIYRVMAKLLLPLGDIDGRVDRFIVAVYPLLANDTVPASLHYALAG